MHPERLKTRLNFPLKKTGDYVLYWMQQSQRTENNFALEHAAKAANALDLPLRVVFCVAESFLDANARHYAFLLEGLKPLVASFKRMGAEFLVEIGAFEDVVADHMERAALFVMDKAYLRPLRQVRERLLDKARNLALRTDEVESELIVPVEVASDKVEYAARTIRPKILKRLEEFTEEAFIPALRVRRSFSPGLVELPMEETIRKLNIDKTMKKSFYFHGGEKEAKNMLREFLEERLADYHKSSDPGKDLTSKLSPYLHFGHISPLTIHAAVEERLAERDVPPHAAEAFLEQLVVRRGLAFNFAYFHDGYDVFEKMTLPWAYETMERHLEDEREYLYTLADYEKEKDETHDEYFNAAMREMKRTGHMHNTLRMYWAKQIIRWSADYEEAYETIVHLNNKYLLDGRDPNTYASIAWCFGRHDQGFEERPVFGKLRPMVARGLERKFDIGRYVAYVKRL